MTARGSSTDGRCGECRSRVRPGPGEARPSPGAGLLLRVCATASPQALLVRFVRALVLLAVLAVLPAASLRAELEISGEKDFQFRDYGLKGDFSQFIHENPLFLGGKGFEQSLRLEITGTIGDRVHVDVSLDDSDEDEEDKKLLVRVDGRTWDLTLGRLNLNLPDHDYLLFNRTVLGMTVEGRLGKHRIVALAGRPEGRAERNFFQGAGSRQEYVLTDRDGVRNPRVVQGSEVVDIDGRVLSRGADYTMDYEEGAIVFDRHVLPIEETSRITVTFETMDSGSVFQSTIMGFRHEMSLDGGDWTTSPSVEEKGGYEHRDYLAWTVLRDADDRGAAAQSESTATPRELVVAGVDGALSLPGDMRLEIEGARSMLDRDVTSDDDDVESSSAYTLSLSRRSRRHELVVTRRRVAPGFEAVGRDRFAKLGRDSDMVSDVDSLSARNVFRFGRGLTLSSEADEARTNLDGSPDRPVTDFRKQSHSLVWKGNRGASMDLRYLDENSTVPDRPPGAENQAVSGDREAKRLASASADIPIGPVVLQASASTEDNEAPGPGTEDYQTARLGLSSKAGGLLSWGLGYTVRQVDVDDLMEKARLDTEARLDLRANPGRSLSTDFNLSRRIERNFNRQDGSRPERMEADTGEARLRWKPGRSLELSLKGSLEQRSRILFQRDERDITASVNHDAYTTNTIVTENPVLTFVTSNSLEWRPGRRWEHRFQFRQRYEKDAVDRKLYSSSVSTDYRGKWSPSHRLRFTGDAVKTRSSSVTAGTDLAGLDAGVEALYNFSSGLSLKLDSRFTDTDDRKNDAQDETVRSGGLELKRSIDRTWTARGGLRRTSRKGTASSLERAFDLGVVCTPPGSGLRWELAFKNGAIDGRDTSGRRFASFSRRIALELNSRLGKDTRLEGKLQRIAAGPDGKGGQGYEATTTELKVSVDF